MPTATPFTALGAGNGFPFCPVKRNVSVYDYWVTLGGYKKTDTGGPTQAQVDLSLKNAMQLFWNLDGWTGLLYFGAVIGGNPPDAPNASYEITSLSMKNGDWTVSGDRYYATKLDGTIEFDEPDFDPKDRVCYKSFKAIKYVAANAPSGISLGGYPFRMYNGDTSDEDNFVGYGWYELMGASLSYQYYFLYFSSYQDGTPASSTNDWEDISYVEIPTNIEGITIPAVGHIESYYFGAGGIPYDFDVYSWGSLQFEQSNPNECAFKIDSLDFYTYP